MYPCHAIIVSIEISSGQQQFFMGHTDKVMCRFYIVTIFICLFAKVCSFPNLRGATNNIDMLQSYSLLK